MQKILQTLQIHKNHTFKFRNILKIWNIHSSLTDAIHTRIF